MAVTKCCTLNFPAVSWSSPFYRPSVPLHDTISLIFYHQSGRLILSPHSLRTPSRPWRGVICHGSHWSVLEESRDCSAQDINPNSPCRFPHHSTCPTSGFVHLSVSLGWKRPPDAYRWCTNPVSKTLNVMWICHVSSIRVSCRITQNLLNTAQNPKDLWKCNWFNCSGDLFGAGTLNWKEA